MIQKLVLINLLFFCIANAESISQHGQYAEYCLKASQNDKEFQNFKRNPAYRCILEHATYTQGSQYLDAIYWFYPSLLQKINEFRKNDLVGNPVTYSYPLVGNMSPTTLQYIKIAGELNQYFGDLSQLRIVEIGGGYGGQCFILSKLSGFQHYTIIDLPECLPLTERYLKTQNIDNFSLFNNEQFSEIPSSDLLISNYAFSEISYQEQLDYLEKLIKRIPMGYMTMNFISKLFGVDSLSEKEVIQFLETSGASVKILSETPPTGDNNIILMWKPRIK